jgi:ribosomal protein S18 acetylase RimI-like enzyme
MQRVTDARLATVEEVPALAVLLADAFVDDAIMRWTVQGEGREERVRTFFEDFDRYTAERGWLWTVGDGAGVALWVPPGTGAEFEELTFAAEDAGPTYDSFWTWAEAARPAEPHWYLDHLAVDAGVRGTGLGVALIDRGLGLARAEGAPAFLCTSRPDNVGFYERRGFVVERAADAPGGGPHIWFMRAEP